MTVSRALRGLPIVRADVAEAVRRTAGELGYRPDPLVQSLMTQRAKRHGQRSSGVAVAWLGDGGPAWGRGKTHPFRRYYAGAFERLEQTGFRLSDFSNLSSGIRGKPSRLGHILRTRGFTGLLLGPIGKEEPMPVDNPEAFALVQIGRSRHDRAIDRVAMDAYQAMTTCMVRLRAAGFRRIGFFDAESHNLRNERRWEAAFAINQPARGRIPPLLVMEKHPFTREDLKEYVKARRLDAVVSGRIQVHNWLRSDARLRDLGFASPNLEEAAGPAPGVVADFEGIGAAAAELLADAIHAGRRGLQARSRTLSIAGEWHAGELEGVL